jgi:copper chaperone CopZ
MNKILLVCLVALLGIGSADAQKPKKGEKKSVTVEFVTNIDCEGCAKKVYNTIPYEKGVEDVKVDVATKIVTVTYNPAKTNNETLIKAFDKIKLEAAVAEGKCEGECCGEHKHEHKHNHEGDCCGEHNHDHKHEQKKCEDDCCK